MATAIGVRSDYTSADFRGFARRCRDPDQVRHVLALTVILDGGSRSDAAQMAGVTLQIVRDWGLKFNDGGPEGLATPPTVSVRRLPISKHRQVWDKEQQGKKDHPLPTSP